MVFTPDEAKLVISFWVEATSRAQHKGASRLCSRASPRPLALPPTPKHRRIRRGNAVFQRVLGGPSEATAIACLRHVGFVDGVDPENGSELLVIGTADAALLTSAGHAALERARLYEAWPARARSALPSCCAALEATPTGVARPSASSAAQRGRGLHRFGSG